MKQTITMSTKQFNDLATVLTQLSNNSDIDINSYIENHIGIELPDQCYTHLEEIIARLRYNF